MQNKYHLFIIDEAEAFSEELWEKLKSIDPFKSDRCCEPALPSAPAVRPVFSSELSAPNALAKPFTNQLFN